MSEKINDIKLYDKDEIDFDHNGLFLPDFEDEPIINRVINGRFVLTGVYSLSGQHSEKLAVGSILKAYTPNKTWQLFRINKINEKTLTTISFTANHISFDTNRNFIEYMFADRLGADEIMNKIQNSLAFKQPFHYFADFEEVHQFTIKENYPMDALIGSNNQAQNLVGVANAELDVDNFEIKLTKRLGQDRGFVIDFGLNLDSIVETTSGEQCPNSLYLIGAVPDGDYDSEKNPIILKYVQPKGFVVTDSNRVIGKYTNSECKSKEELKKWAENELFGKKKIHLPKVSHQVSIIDLASTDEYAEYKDLFELQLGDSVHGKLQKQDITLEERMIEYNWYPRIGAYKDMVLGNDLGFYTNTVQQAVEATLKKVEEVQETAYENLLNASKVITGNDGGYVVHWPKNRPSDILIMDTPDIKTAKRVLRMNKSGIGFSKNGWNPQKFETAWTIDGVFNANFIGAGKIRADIFETSFNAYGDILRLASGALQAWNGKTKIMELTRKGMEFWDGSSHVGTIGTKGNPFPELNDVNGNPVVTDGKALLLVGDSSYNTIGLSNEKSTGLVLSGKNQFHLGNHFYFIGKGGNKSTIYVDRLIVGGKEVIPGDGSGGNDGDVPPELTTEKGKNAWAVWQFLKSKGYSEQAAAGILGNMDQESGIMPDIDEGGGGPGYGLVQWTSPIAGESGRAYVQRLLGQAGIGGDYRNITTQLKLLDWHMHNGQYIPSAAYPYSVSEFKALTDIGTATMAFEANFERPAVTHPERIPMAQYWYNLLKDLKPSKLTWMNPVRSTYTITQEWDQIGWGTNVIHGGIDIASVPAGTSPPVYVARSGTVETVTYDGTGGNYVVIKHDDGYWTYYGHLDSVDLVVGEKVTTSSRVGIMGSTGLAKGIHLHFEVWKGAQWKRINPRDVINF
ncbi:phage tail tip lysozyme [Enterococcus faecalis]|uniref:Phage minor structural protein n=1 Tax=Enterococcus faecalis ATCC 6055 TaxID=1169311 RepID=R3IEK3_ENTFL|nr:phage tail tip lysozyme [Enterococcus faecalis]EOK16158.1 phage minor structural protein [Enterococcus faecalis ATCC 6055]